MFDSDNKKVASKAKKISELLPAILQRQCFQQRSHLGHLVKRWKELFEENEFGTLVERNGDVLIVKVKGAPMRSELENFKKWDMLEILHTEEEFLGIRDLQFRE